MTTNTKAVNAALKAAGINGEIVKGNGYWYFSGDDFANCETGLYGGWDMRNTTAAQFVAEARDRINDANN